MILQSRLCSSAKRSNLGAKLLDQRVAQAQWGRYLSHRQPPHVYSMTQFCLSGIEFSINSFPLFRCLSSKYAKIVSFERAHMKDKMLLHLHGVDWH